MKNLEIKNIALTYISKVHPHLYTRDGKTFMKVIPVGNLAIRLHFGKEPSVRIIQNLGKYALVSSADKAYLSPHLKEQLFPGWGERYHSVKGGKKFLNLFDQVADVIDLDAEQSEWSFLQHAEKEILRILTEYFAEAQ